MRLLSLITLTLAAFHLGTLHEKNEYMTLREKCQNEADKYLNPEYSKAFFGFDKSCLITYNASESYIRYMIDVCIMNEVINGR